MQKHIYFFASQGVGITPRCGVIPTPLGFFRKYGHLSGHKNTETLKHKETAIERVSKQD